MSQVIIKKICDVFAYENGKSKYTKSYCKEHSGEFIVYTGTTIGVFGTLDTADYTNPHLTFTTDGEKAGTLEYISDKGYCIGGHRTILKPLDESINLQYFKYILQPLFFKKVKRGNIPSIRFNRIKDETVPIPILPNGEYDLETQKEVVLKFQEIERQKEKLLIKIKKIKNSTVIFEGNNLVKYKEVFLNDMFTFKRGTVFSKHYIFQHKGDYPVYSTQVNGVFGYIDSFMYDGNYLLWNTDGLAGYIKQVHGKFNLTNIVGIMQPKKNFDFTNISLAFLKYYLEPIFRNKKKGRTGENGKNEYTKLNSSMLVSLNIKISIPIDDKGNFDLEKQIELANKRATVESIKSEIYKNISELISINIL